eukprot:TRINITY_DN130_c2_g1_i1.p1 TRINITY_DN130_c2_g1~~TRINITY_DN130_c2_g1_i1.p1  ORF type:complete len:494 (-),score=124.14 TRINITY_DN130_c2_g1_i1:221-1594(-)
MAAADGSLNVSRLIKTKIVCTLGPASASEEVLEKMILAGMDVCRLNFSHGTHEDHRNTFNLVRKLSAKHDHQVSILCDIQGPKLRTGKMKEPFQCKAGELIQVTPNEVPGGGTPERIQLKYKTILKDLDVGDLIYINDGVIRLVVRSKEETHLNCEVEAGGLISDHKGCNIPSGNISLDVVTPKDVKDLVLIAELNPEWVAASFIGTADDVMKVKRELEKNGNTDIKVISKIERPVALKNIDAILAVTDGVMVARGDLGVEIPTWDVPAAQKMLCNKSNKLGKPVIVATQMLESMISSARPTRAEASDVFNAVIDGADAVMLSGETSVGSYVVEAVTNMDQIIAVAEKHITLRNPRDFNSPHIGATETLAHGFYSMTKVMTGEGVSGKGLIVTGGPSAYVARMVSKYRPPIDIIAVTHDIRTARELNLIWGIRSLYNPSLMVPNFLSLAGRGCGDWV